MFVKLTPLLSDSKRLMEVLDVTILEGVIEAIDSVPESI